jgi:hypothetical protein
MRITVSRRVDADTFVKMLIFHRGKVRFPAAQSRGLDEVLGHNSLRLTAIRGPVFDYPLLLGCTEDTRLYHR